jgi:hypothetical protein
MHGPTRIFWANLTPFSLQVCTSDWVPERVVKTECDVHGDLTPKCSATRMVDAWLFGSGLLTQGVPRVPRDPVEDPLDPLQIGERQDRKRARTSAGTFGSIVRPTAAH